MKSWTQVYVPHNKKKLFYLQILILSFFVNFNFKIALLVSFSWEIDKKKGTCYEKNLTWRVGTGRKDMRDDILREERRRNFLLFRSRYTHSVENYKTGSWMRCHRLIFNWFLFFVSLSFWVWFHFLTNKWWLLPGHILSPWGRDRDFRSILLKTPYLQ